MDADMQLECYNHNWGQSFCTYKCQFFYECREYRREREKVKSFQQDVDNMLKTDGDDNDGVKVECLYGVE